jgi:hypothetical protein
VIGGGPRRRPDHLSASGARDPAYTTATRSRSANSCSLLAATDAGWPTRAALKRHSKMRPRHEEVVVPIVAVLLVGHQPRVVGVDERLIPMRTDVLDCPLRVRIGVDACQP